MRRQTLILGVAIAIVAGLFASCTSLPELNDRVRAYVEEFNAHNLEGVASRFTNDATFEIKGLYTVEGKQALKDLMAYDMALDAHISVGNMRTAGDTVFAHLTVTNHWLEAAGIGEAHSQAMFIFHDGSIGEFIGTLTPETQAAFDDVMGPMLAWAKQQAPDRLEEMMPDGQFAYNADNAERALALLEDWKRSTEEAADSAGR